MISRLQAVLDLPRAHPAADRADAFWSDVLGWPLGSPWPDHPELATFTPPTGAGYVHRQRVDPRAPATHLVVEVADPDLETTRLVALGAAAVRSTPDGRTLRSPGGLEFCLVRGTSGERPAAVVGPEGTRRRLVQVCLDVPTAAVPVELAFWRAALGWSEVHPAFPEFPTRFVPPAGSPLQVLVQQLGPDDGGSRTRAHLDLGCDDLEAMATLAEAAGGRRLATHDHFVVLEDPVGTAFCVTDNSPDAP